MKRGVAKKFDNALIQVIDGMVAKNPHLLYRKDGNTIKIGDVMAKKGELGIDIYKKGKVVYSGLRQVDAVQAIIDRLILNKKVSDIKDILKLEDRYVSFKNDMMFMKHSHSDKNKSDDDKEILEHRMGIVLQNMRDLTHKLCSYKIK